MFRDDENENILFGVEDSVLREEDSLDSIAANLREEEEMTRHEWIDEEKIRQSRMNAVTPIAKKENSAPSNLKSENRKLKERIAYLSRLGKRNTKRLSNQARNGAEIKSLRTETEQLKSMLDNRDAEIAELRRQVQALSIENKNSNVNKEEYDNLLLEHTRLRSESTTRKKTHDVLKAQLENERARSTEIEERVIELEQILFERDRDTNKIQSEVDMLQAKLNASEESRCQLEKKSNEMTRRAEESEKWIESHEEMTKEMESMREKFKNSETQNKNLQSELENSKTTISEMELKIRSLETESATSLKRVTTENESCKSHLNAKILKLSEELEVERRRVQTAVSKLERIALKRLDRAIVSRQRSDCGHALQVWKGKTEQSIRTFQVLGIVVMRCVQRKRRDMLRRGFHGLIRGIEIVKAQVYLRDLRQEYDEKMCRLESTCQKKCSAMRDAHTIALEEARRDAISARSRALKESSREEFREALRLNRSLQIQEDKEKQIENRKQTNEKISSLREMIVREQRKGRVKESRKIVRPEDTMLGSTIMYARSLASGVHEKKKKKEKSWKTRLSEYAASTSSPSSSPQLERIRRVRTHIASVERLMIKVRNQGVSSGISSSDVNEVLSSTNTLLNRAKTWTKDGDIKSAMSAIKEASARANAAREAIFVMSSRRYLASVETSLESMDIHCKKTSKLKKLIHDTRVGLREMSVEKIQERLGLISELYKTL
eukprot:g216.t1